MLDGWFKKLITKNVKTWIYLHEQTKYMISLSKIISVL